MWFAHTETGKALDPTVAKDPQDYLRIIGTNPTGAGWNVEQVPDGTQQGATFQNGQWVNPPVPVQPTPAAPTSTDELQKQLSQMTDQLTALQVLTQKIADTLGVK